MDLKPGINRSGEKHRFVPKTFLVKIIHILIEI